MSKSEIKNSTSVSLKMLRISPRKLNLLAGLIRGMKVSEAVLQLTFSQKRIARDVKKCIQSAVINAENTIQGVDIDNLVVLLATVGKAMTLKRVMPRARGRVAPIKKYFSNLYITIGELKSEGKR